MEQDVGQRGMSRERIVGRTGKRDGKMELEKLKT